MPDDWTADHNDPEIRLAPMGPFGPDADAELAESLALLTPTHPLIRYFSYLHLPPHLRGLSASYLVMASELDDTLRDGPEKTAALCRLLESKDWAVRGLLPAERPTDDQAQA